MPLLRYRALTRAGAREAGVVEAPTPAAATNALQARGLIVLDVSANANPAGVFGARIRRGDLAEFTRALAALLPAGLPLARALSVAADIAPDALRIPLTDVQLRVQRGSTFADALAAHPHAFAASYVGLVRAGERAGNLNDSIARLADAIESQEEFRAKIVTAAIYPTLLAFVGGAAILVLLMIVLPRFGALFVASGSALPASTAFVLALSRTLRIYVAPIVLVLVLFSAFMLWLATSRDAADTRSRLFLSLPLVSHFYREVLAARTARVISILLGGGAPFVVALDDAARSLDDPAAQREVLRIRSRVREGTSPAAAFAEGTLFPSVLARLVAAGEESSQLESFFTKAADLFEERAKRSAARFVALAEPALIIVFGMVVGLIALALVQAIYGINLAPMRGAR
ncbi:MAG: type II secretion system F family protein [Gemmatimonadota bacterium]|nr:type II secretion system F family protein [Gemmatimonadota bacterium]